MTTLHQNYRNIVVIGASAGGLEAILDIVKVLPQDFRAAVFIVQHIPAYAKSSLDTIIQGYTKLRVRKAVDGEPIQGGTIYVVREDRHLMVEPDRVVVSKGPRENRFRPAVDTLFRSAAHAYRERVVGIVLSGALNDGTSGMWTINRFGGTAIVQDPKEAMFPDMPNGVMQYTEVEHVLPAGKIGQLLATLCQEEIVPSRRGAGVTDEKLLEIEIEIAKGKNGLNMGILEHGDQSPLACPECHGALTQFEEGRLVRFRCHTGHAHTAESLLASVRDNVEKSMWEVMRGMEESRILLDRMAEQMQAVGNHEDARRYRERGKDIQEQAVLIQQAIVQSDLSEEGEEGMPSINAQRA